MQTLVKFLIIFLKFRLHSVHVSVMNTLIPYAGWFHLPTAASYSPPNIHRDHVCPLSHCVALKFLSIMKTVLFQSDCLWSSGLTWWTLFVFLCGLVFVCIKARSAQCIDQSAKWHGSCHYLTFHQFLYWLQIWQALSLLSFTSSRSVLNHTELMRFLLNFQNSPARMTIPHLQYFFWQAAANRFFLLCAAGLLMVL